jgi:Uma2 family endonuclease
MTAEEFTPGSEVHEHAGPARVAEVRSAADRTSTLLKKVAGHLNAGAKVVCVIDPQKRIVSIHTEDDFARVLTAADELTLPEVFADFRVAVKAFFE